MPGGTTGVPHAVSFEDLRRHRDHTLSSSKRSVDSFGGNIRRTRSDTDVALQSLKKKVEVSMLQNQHVLVCMLCRVLLQSLTVDNTKLKNSEKKLIKEKIKLTRHCKVRK